MTTVELFCSSATPPSPWGTESTTTSSSVASTTSSSKIITETGRDVGAVAVGEKEREKAPNTKSRPATERDDMLMADEITVDCAIFSNMGVHVLTWCSARAHMMQCMCSRDAVHVVTCAVHVLTCAVHVLTWCSARAHMMQCMCSRDAVHVLT